MEAKTNNQLEQRRDLFAAAALQGLLAGRNHAATPYTPDEVAEMSVKIADAMIAAFIRKEQEIK